MRSRERPVLSVASELRFTKRGVLPTTEALSLAERIQAALDAPVVAGLHSLAASSLAADEPPDEDAFVCGDDAEAKALALELAGRAHQRARARCRPAGERACARGDDRGDREHEPSLQGSRGNPGHGPSVTGELRVIPLRGIPELEEGDDLGAFLVDAAREAGSRAATSSSSPRRRSRRSRVASSTSAGSSRPSVRIELAADDDPRRLEVILRESPRGRSGAAAARHRRDPPRLRVRVRRGRRSRTRRARTRSSCFPVDPDASATRIRARHPRRSRESRSEWSSSDSFGRAWRLGTTDVALGVAGIAALLRPRRPARLGRLRAPRDADRRRRRDRRRGASSSWGSSTACRPRSSAVSTCAETGFGRDLLMPRERDLFR